MRSSPHSHRLCLEPLEWPHFPRLPSFRSLRRTADEDLLRLNTGAVIDRVYLLELRASAPAGTTA